MIPIPMRHILLPTIALAALTLGARCNKHDHHTTGNDAFCQVMEQEGLDATGTVVNTFLAQLSEGETQGLEKLLAWLDEKSCVTEATLICHSCIETLPPQSEIRLVLHGENLHLEKTMDIAMETPLRFVRYHD